MTGFASLWRRRDAEPSETYLVVGLGNPGPQYEGTRHNVGFDVVDRLAEQWGVRIRQQKFGGRLASCREAEKKVILFKPMQFMNRSGQPVATVIGFYRLPLERLLVVYDDMALDVGTVRLRARGSAGGHNGMADILARLKSQEVARCRVGIGSASPGQAVDYVLGRPDAEQRTALREGIRTAASAVTCWIRDGIDAAMTRFNGQAGGRSDSGPPNR